jgi:hypothetical protein
MNEFLDVNPSNLDGESIYDYNEHLPFPTLNYIEKETGINLMTAIKSEQETYAFVRMMTKLTRDLIFGAIKSETRPKLEYLIAKSEDYRKSFIDMVCGMIFITRIKGLESVLVTGEIGIKELPKMVQAKGYMMFTNQYRFILTKDQIRSDY